MNGHTQHLQGHHPDGDGDSDRGQPLQNDSFTLTQIQTQTAAGSKTSSPTKRAFAYSGLGDSNDTSAHKKARLTSQVDEGQDSALFEKNVQDTPLQHPRPRRLPSPLAHPLDPLDAFVSQWLQTVGLSECQRNCRSDSSLDRLREEEQAKVKVKRAPKRTRSVPPAMDRKDADGFAIPRTPLSRSRASSGSSARGRQPGNELGSEYTRDSSSPSRTTVEHPGYRLVLERNHVTMSRQSQPRPDYVDAVVAQVREKKRDSPEPTDEALSDSRTLWNLFQGTPESDVEVYYTDNVFPKAPETDAVQSRARLPMNRLAVPNVGGGVPKFCTPAPDLLYGYSIEDAFPDAGHQGQLKAMSEEVMANNDYSSYNALVFPFFVVEYKGVGGNMWVAGNQCLGGAATCVSIADKLNRRLFEYAQTKIGKGKGKGSSSSSSKPDGVTAVASVDNMAFSVAMNGQDARLYVSWKQDELNYYMTNVDCYALFRPDEYKRFRRMVRNIVDWGRSDRLKAIHRGLDQLLEEAQQRTPAPDTDAEAEAEAAAMDPMAMSMPEPMPEPTPGAGSSKASRHHSPPSGKGSSGGGGRSKKPRA